MAKTFLTVAQAAERAQFHPMTIWGALRDGRLHGSQRVKRGSWRIDEECLDAWLANEKCAHKAKKVAA